MGAVMKALAVSRSALVDGALLLVLAMVASIGFRDTFTGWTYLVAAFTGWLLGICLGHVANVLGKPVVLLAVFTIVAFFLLGGAVALHGEGISRVLPVPDTIGALADQSVHGWKDLLTTLAPVDGGPLLTLPYLMGLVGGAGGMALAGRSRSALAPVLAPLAYLVAVILLGVSSPDRITLIGGVFAVVALAFAAVRARRTGSKLQHGSRWRRRVTAVALVAAAGALATTVGPSLPFTQSHERVVLRSYVTPPFDVGQYTSPLVSFRKYTKGYRVKKGSPSLYSTVLMTVEGDLPADRLIKFASLDQYDGLVWGAANRSAGSSGTEGTFQSVGSVIRTGATGSAYDLTVTIGPGYRDVWMPTVGTLSGIRFGSDLETRAEYFRYNIDSSTGVVPEGLGEGDRYSMTGVSSDTVADDSLEPSAATRVPVVSDVDFLPVAQKWSGAASGGMEQVLAMAHYLRDRGRYTDGEAQFAQFLAGHSVNRLSKFSADGQQIAGDDEQYAAMLALLSNAVGVPARVAVGAVVPAGGVVTGKDVRAWIELQDVSGQWRVLPTEEFMSRERPPEQDNPQPQQLVAGEAVPPPAPVRPPSTDGDPFSDTANQKGKATDDGGGPSIPGWVFRVVKLVGIPLFILSIPLIVIAAFKSQRRKRRRTRGSPATRLSAAWHDLVDQARDLGRPTFAQRTRREQVRDLGIDELAPLARRVDAHVFGPDEPTDEDAEVYWASVDQARADLVDGLPRLKRWKTMFNPVSLRGPGKGVVPR